MPDIPCTELDKLAELAVHDGVRGRPVKTREGLANLDGQEHFRNRPELEDQLPPSAYTLAGYTTTFATTARPAAPGVPRLNPAGARSIRCASAIASGQRRSS